MMKKLGVVGGVGWLSTIEYYRLLCERSNAHFSSLGLSRPYPSPPMLIESLNMHETRSLRGVEGDDESWHAFDDVFRRALLRLEAAGAEFAIIASNTPHMRFDAICSGVNFPVLSILDATAKAASATGARRALVLGTPVTMRSDAYATALNKQDVRVLPRCDERRIDDLARLIDTDIYQGNLEKARDYIVSLCTADLPDPKHDVVCLACTEFPLVFPENTDDAVFTYQGITFINTVVAHVEATLAELGIPNH